MDSIYPLIKHAAECPNERVPDEVVAKAGELFADMIACVFAGNKADGVGELRRVVKAFGGEPHSTVIGFGEKTSPPQAAFLNSVMGHARDFDDTHDPAVNHGCVTIVPAMLATLERALVETPDRRFSGREFLAALAVGLDVANRMGMAFIRHLHTGWLPTTLWGPFGCAAACGRLLEFDVSAMERAFGVAYSLIHGNRQTLADGALAKRVQPGFSAEAGVKAVFMAREGITGAINIIDGAFGVPALYTDDCVDRSHLTENLGLKWETLNISLKPWPCCRCTHPVIDATRHLKRCYSLAADQLERGEIQLPPKGMGQIGRVFTIRGNPTVDAQFNAAYTAALALRNDEIGIDDFLADNVIEREDLLDLAAKFDVVEDFRDAPGLTPVNVILRLKNGDELSRRIEDATGSPGNPMSEERMRTKFRDCLRHAAREFSDEAIETLFTTLQGLREVDNVASALNAALFAG